MTKNALTGLLEVLTIIAIFIFLLAYLAGFFPSVQISDQPAKPNHSSSIKKSQPLIS